MAFLSFSEIFNILLSWLLLSRAFNLAFNNCVVRRWTQALHLTPLGWAGHPVQRSKMTPGKPHTIGYFPLVSAVHTVSNLSPLGFRNFPNRAESFTDVVYRQIPLSQSKNSKKRQLRPISSQHSQEFRTRSTHALEENRDA